MDTKFIILLILMICAVVLSFAAVLLALKNSKKDKSQENAVLTSKVDMLASTVSAELSNSRKENMQMMNSVNGKISEMSEKNLNMQHKIVSTVNESLAEIRTANAQQNEKVMATLVSSVEKMTEKNEKKLEEMRMTVDEKLTSTLTTRLDSSFKTVSGQLEKLYTSLGEMKELSGGITQNVSSLNRVLTNVKSRGTWAEYQLESILDQTVPNMYVKNFKPDGMKDFVEFAIKLPSGDDSKKISYLPIDSKFPMEDYARLCAAADSADGDAVAAARKALEARVLSEAKTVAKYIAPPQTTPFAIMYLATEGLYAEIASSKSGIFEKIQNEYSVMIAGPTTVTALLNSVAMGLRTIAVNEKANEIKELLAAIKKQYEVFDAALKKVKKKLGEADASIDDVTKRNEIIQKKLKGIDAAESLTADNILGIEE